MASYSPAESSFVLVWAGEDPALHSALLEELESAGIPFADKSLGDDQVAPTADPLPIDWKPRFGFEVAVLSSDLAPAQQILEVLLAEEPADLELPAQGEAPAMAPAPSASSDTHIAVEVWAGSDHKLSQFLIEALRENAISFQFFTTPLLTKICVPSSAEFHAREIIREVTEAAPPQ
jgi:hypothetical protein